MGPGLLKSSGTTILYRHACDCFALSGGHDKVKLVMPTSGYVIECQYRLNFIGKQ